MRGTEGEEGEAVTEEVGTWWRTLGPVEAILAQMFEAMVVRIGGDKGKRPSVTSKVAKKIALSISRDGWKFTRLDGSVVGVVVSHYGHEVRLVKGNWIRARYLDPLAWTWRFWKKTVHVYEPVKLRRQNTIRMTDAKWQSSKHPSFLPGH